MRLVSKVLYVEIYHIILSRLEGEQTANNGSITIVEGRVLSGSACLPSLTF